MESCTAFAINSPGGLFLTHNTDDYYLLTLEGAVTIFKPNQGLGYPFVSFGSAVFGGVTMGENLAGLAVVYNAAFPSNKCLGLPPPIMIRKVIQECGSIEEAIQVFQSFIDGGGCFGYMGGNVTLIDFKIGEMARLELASDRVEVDHGTTWENNRFVVSTNHYRLMPERNQRKDYNTSSYARYERTLMLLKMGEDFSVEKIIKILSDHDGKKHGTNHTICRHKNLNLGTSNSLFFDDQFVLYYILGNPCQYWEDPTTLQMVRWREMLDQN
jgi:predicted choloylglycine hydrolase